MTKKKKSKKDKKAKVHKDLDGLELKINDMGHVESNIDIDKINDFLDKHVHDKKLENEVDEEEEEDDKAGKKDSKKKKDK